MSVRARLALAVLCAVSHGCATEGESAVRARAERPWRQWAGWPARPAHDGEVQCPPLRGPADLMASDVGERVIQRHARWFRRCYLNSARFRPQLVGTLRSRFTVRCDGTVAPGVRLEGMDEAPELRSCVRDLLRALEFPRPNGGEATFAYPFTFLPQRVADREE